jgi:hypothetical protein
LCNFLFSALASSAAQWGRFDPPAPVGGAASLLNTAQETNWTLFLKEPPESPLAPTPNRALAPTSRIAAATKRFGCRWREVAWNPGGYFS